jgi:hypothetical protein
MNTYLESLDLQITLSSILGEENEYNKLIKKRREFLLNFLLDKEKEQDIEKDYFEDDN